MIVRILTDNQYRLDDQHGTQLTQLDEQLVAAMTAGNSAQFASTLQQVVALVRDSGTLVGLDEVVPSDVIVPAPDMSLEEARELLSKSEMHLAPHKSTATDAPTSTGRTGDAGGQE
jgi:hypothetical protein